MFHYIIKNKLLLIMFVILVPISSMISILFALSIEPIITAAITFDTMLLVKSGIFCCIFSICDILFGLFLKRSKEKLINDIVYNMRMSFVNSLLSRQVNEFQGNDKARYLTLFSNDSERIKNSYIGSVCNLYQVGCGFLFSIITILCINWWIALFLLVIGLLSVMLPSRFEKKLQSVQEMQMNGANRHIGLLKDIFSGFGIIKNYKMEEHIRDEYKETNKDLAEGDFQVNYYPYKIACISMSFSSIAFVGVILISAFLVIEGHMEMGIIISLSQLIGGVLVPFETIPQNISELKGIKRVIAEVLKLIGRNSEKKEGEMEPIKEFDELKFETKAVPNSSLVQYRRQACDMQGDKFENINFSYPNTSEVVLKHIDIEIKKGKKYAIVGSSGSGKSTLAKVMAGIYPAEYRYTADGIVESRSSLLQKVSYMNQDVFLFHKSIYYNIDLYKGIPRNEILSLLSRLQFPEEAIHMEGFLDSDVGEEGSSFSGGERQRIGLARELVNPKDILILDEFTAGLDNITAQQIEDLVIRLSDKTCVMVTHRLNQDMLRACDGIFVMSEGRIVERGTFEELIRNQSYFYRLLSGVRSS